MQVAPHALRTPYQIILQRSTATRPAVLQQSDPDWRRAALYRPSPHSKTAACACKACAATKAGAHLEGGVDRGAAAPAEEERRNPAELVAQPARRPHPPHVLRKAVPLKLHMHARGVVCCLLGIFCSVKRSRKSSLPGVRLGKLTLKACHLCRPDISASQASTMCSNYLPMLFLQFGATRGEGKETLARPPAAKSGVHVMLQLQEQLTSPGISSSLGRSKSRPQTMSPSCCSSRMVSRAQK